MKQRLDKSGFTLVEVAVGAAILAVMTVVLWQIFTTIRRMNEVSTWQSARQMQLKHALKLIRTDLQEASYPTIVTRISSEIVDQADHGFSYKPDGPFTIDSASSGDYLRFYMSKPRKRVYPTGDSRNSDGYVCECRLGFNGTDLVYNRSLSAVAGGTPDAENILEFTDKILVHDVSSFNVQVNSAASAEYNMNFCTITISCLHPNPKINSSVTERTGTKIEVAADPSL